MSSDFRFGHFSDDDDLKQDNSFDDDDEEDESDHEDGSFPCISSRPRSVSEDIWASHRHQQLGLQYLTLQSTTPHRTQQHDGMARTRSLTSFKSSSSHQQQLEEDNRRLRQQLTEAWARIRELEQEQPWRNRLSCLLPGTPDEARGDLMESNSPRHTGAAAVGNNEDELTIESKATTVVAGSGRRRVQQPNDKKAQTSPLLRPSRTVSQSPPVRRSRSLLSRLRKPNNNKVSSNESCQSGSSSRALCSSAGSSAHSDTEHDYSTGKCSRQWTQQSLKQHYQVQRKSRGGRSSSYAVQYLLRDAVTDSTDSDNSSDGPPMSEQSSRFAEF